MARLVILLAVMAIALSLWAVNEVEAAVTLPKPMKLEWHYYKVHNTCDDAEEYIRHQVNIFWNQDRSVTSKLLRLLYSDCFVTGCDASILLDGSNSEKTAPQNRGLGAFIIIEKIKQVLEQYCPGVVSCADILNLATRDALRLAGAPSYPVFTGRRDGMKSTRESVDLPSPYISWKQTLGYFQSKGLDTQDMVTLLGAHSMGKAHCRYVEDRLYNYKNTGKQDPSMNSTIANQLRKVCLPRTKKGQSDPLVFLNPESGSNYRFTNSYYSRIKTHEAVLEVDQQLLYGDASTIELINEFAEGFEDFRQAFALSMSRMGSINVLTGQDGEIRRNCSSRNANNPKNL